MYEPQPFPVPDFSKEVSDFSKEIDSINRTYMRLKQRGPKGRDLALALLFTYLKRMAEDKYVLSTEIARLRRRQDRLEAALVGSGLESALLGDSEESTH